MKNKIRVHRAEREITQEQLAQGLGVTRQTIIAIEKGKYDPSLSLAFRIARFFNVRVDEIFIDDEASPGKP
ncbi:helix-turn-helix protein [anaerobic digester metagenome]